MTTISAALAAVQGLIEVRGRPLSVRSLQELHHNLGGIHATDLPGRGWLSRDPARIPAQMGCGSGRCC